MEFPVYEYYDGYEELWQDLEENDRTKVRYVVLGDLDEHNLVISYVHSDLHCTTYIGKSTHEKAWENGILSITEVLKYLMNSVRVNKQKLLHKVRYLQENKEYLDNVHKQKPGYSSSTYLSEFDIGFYWTSKDSYTDVYLNKLEKKLKLVEVYEDFIERYKK